MKRSIRGLGSDIKGEIREWLTDKGLKEPEDFALNTNTKGGWNAEAQ